MCMKMVTYRDHKGQEMEGHGFFEVSAFAGYGHNDECRYKSRATLDAREGQILRSGETLESKDGLCHRQGARMCRARGPDSNPRQLGYT